MLTNSAPDNSLFCVVWWNGGGRIKSRIESNPGLIKLINDRKPNVFIYGEAQIAIPHDLNLKGYSYYLHASKPAQVDNFRRGMAIFFLHRLKFQLSEAYASNKFDIVWMRLETGDDKPTHFCFFYAPGAHHPLSIRTRFYDIFLSKFSIFASFGKVYLIGDTNARLGSLLCEKNIHGDFVTNQNMPLFKEFIEFSGLTILNKIFCKGTPTYEIVNKKKSIIDLCLTNSLDSVVNFEIYQMPLGVNSQTCHKPRILNILLAPPHARTNDNIISEKKLVFPIASLKDRMKITKSVSSRFSSLRRDGISPDYQLMKEIFLTAKHRFLKRRSGKDKPHKKSYVTHKKSPATVLLQRQFRDAINNMMREKSDFSVFVADHLEKLLYAQHKKEETSKLNKWIARMNDLDFKKRTRTFFKELHRKFRVVEKAGPIQNSSGILSSNLPETLKNWSDFYRKLYEEIPLSFDTFTPDDDPELDRDLTHSEFLDSIYALKNYKAPGADHITSEDVISLIPHVLQEDQIDPEDQISSLLFFFDIFSNFWFNECVPQDFKRTVLRPFLKDHDK